MSPTSYQLLYPALLNFRVPRCCPGGIGNSKSYEPDELPIALPRDMVPETGVEPARDRSHGILSPGRLPIPPLRRVQAPCWCHLEYHIPAPLSTLFSCQSLSPGHFRQSGISFSLPHILIRLFYAKERTNMDKRNAPPTPPKPDVDDLIFAQETPASSDR